MCALANSISSSWNLIKSNGVFVWKKCGIILAGLLLIVMWRTRKKKQNSLRSSHKEQCGFLNTIQWLVTELEIIVSNNWSSETVCKVRFLLHRKWKRTSLLFDPQNQNVKFWVIFVNQKSLNFSWKLRKHTCLAPGISFSLWKAPGICNYGSHLCHLLR